MGVCVAEAVYWIWCNGEIAFIQFKFESVVNWRCEINDGNCWVVQGADIRVPFIDCQQALKKTVDPYRNPFVHLLRPLAIDIRCSILTISSDRWFVAQTQSHSERNRKKIHFYSICIARVHCEWEMRCKSRLKKMYFFFFSSFNCTNESSVASSQAKFCNRHSPHAHAHNTFHKFSVETKERPRRSSMCWCSLGCRNASTIRCREKLASSDLCVVGLLACWAMVCAECRATLLISILCPNRP